MAGDHRARYLVAPVHHRSGSARDRHGPVRRNGQRNRRPAKVGASIATNTFMSSSFLRNRSDLALTVVVAGMIPLLGGCAAVDQPVQRHRETTSAEIRDCARWFASLDETIDHA